MSDALMEINMKSSELFRLACQIEDGEVINIDPSIFEYDNAFKKLIKEVKEENINQAKSQISEAILDLEYLKNPSTDITSLRLYHYIRMKEQAMGNDANNPNPKRTESKRTESKRTESKRTESKRKRLLSLRMLMYIIGIAEFLLAALIILCDSLFMS